MIKLACVISVLNEKKNWDNIKYNISLNAQYVNFYVIDGGSNDGTYEYLESISEVHLFKLFRNENDCGIYDSWNKCLEFVIEDYVCFCGADDLLNPEFSSRVSDFVNNSSGFDNQPDVIYGNAVFELFGNYKTLQPPKSPTLLNVEKYKNCVTFDLFHPGLYMKLSLLILKFDNTIKLAGDLELFVKLYSLGINLKNYYFPINQATIAYTGISTKVSKYRLYMKEYKDIEKKYNVLIRKNNIKYILSHVRGIDCVYNISRKIKWSFL